MSAGLPNRNFAEMKSLLDEVNEELEGATGEGIQYALFVVGGLAMGALYDNRVTQDIDVTTKRLPRPLSKAVQRVAERHQMASNWVNTDFADLVDVELPFSAFQAIYTNRNLVVYGARPEYLLALKLLSGRGKDVPDIVQLANHLGIASSPALLATFDRLLDLTEVHESERLFASSVCDDVASLMKARLEGRDISEDVELLAATYDGQATALEIEDGQDSRTRARPWEKSDRRRARRKKISSHSGKCNAPTKDGGKCSHPLPRRGGNCPAGHPRN